MNEGDQRRNSIEASLKVLNDLHGDTLRALAESEKRDKEFRLMMAEEIWMLVKGVPIPDSYSEDDRLHIFERYYHRASAQRQGE
jgi:hypothetical protein